MTGGGGGEAPPPPPTNGGEFLLQLLQKPPQTQSTISSSPNPPHHLNPAFQSNGHDPHHQLPPWMNPSDFHGFPTAPNNSPWGLAGLPPPPNLQFSGNPPPPIEYQRLGLLGGNGRLGYQPSQSPQREQSMMMFGSVPADFRSHEGGLNGNLLDQLNREVNRMKLESHFGVPRGEVGGASGGSGVRGSSSRRILEVNREFNLQGHRQQWNNSPQGGGKQHVNVGTSPIMEPRSVPPGFPRKPKREDQWGSGSARREIEGNVDKEIRNWDMLNHRASCSYDKGDFVKSNSPSHRIQSNASSRLRLSGQIDHPGPPVGSKFHSVPALDIEQSLGILHGEGVEEDDHNLGMHENRTRDEENDPTHQMSHSRGQEDLGEHLMNSVRRSNGWEKNIRRDNNNNSREDFRVGISRELNPPVQRMRNHRRVVDCRTDIDIMTTPFLAIYDSLVPAEEEKARQKQLLTLLEKLVNKEWPNARLYLYGSCANSFGVSNSDIDVCLALEDENINKSELLLKLADILQEDNLQNVQALTRARVPIVKLMDPNTGISCDICVNNVLAVVNTKLLRDYAQIDGRLRQLAFIVKHWAKTRGVNVTYQGTLSSYAYVLMCIHFLQQRRPAILPCLQGMEATYVVRVDDIECAYFDQVQNLRDFGARNTESIAQLVWAFFDYWAYRHDYTNAVISVRTGSIISKRAKDWTRRIGNDRHLICIEDPFEVSHDLGRVVDKYSIKILREEFERAADIMQYDPNPCVTLFEPYVPPNPK